MSNTLGVSDKASKRHSKKLDIAVRDVSYEEALRAHSRFQTATRTTPTPVQPTPAKKATPSRAKNRDADNDGSLTRTKSGAVDFEAVIQAQIQHLIQSNPEVAAQRNTEKKLTRQKNAQPSKFPLASPRTDAVKAARPEEFCDEESSFQPSENYAQAEVKMVALTVRLIPEDCEEVRLRAKEAGMSISAYLRACALEVEQLRSQVKQMVSTAREQSAEPEIKPNQPNGSKRFHGMLGMFVSGLKSLIPLAPGTQARADFRS